MKNDLDRRLYAAFSRDAAIPDELSERLQECYESVRRSRRKGEIRMDQTKKRKTLRTALIFAAAVCVLAAAALAAVDYSGFFQSVFGDGVAAQEAYDLTVYADDGSVDKTEHYPAVEREAVDTAQAQTILGDYVSAVGQSVQSQGYTFTVREYVTDANGVGAVTIDVENPDGVEQTCVYDDAGSECRAYTLSFHQSGQLVSCREFLDEAASTDTCERWVCYLVPFGEADGELSMTVRTWTGETETESGFDGAEMLAPVYDEQALTLPAAAPVGAESFSGESIEAQLSPVGITLWPEGAQDGFDFITEEMTICFADGSEYTVVGEDVENRAVSAIRSNGSVGMAFNRLVDTDSVTQICLRAFYVPAAQDDAGRQTQELDIVLTR